MSIYAHLMETLEMINRKNTSDSSLFQTSHMQKTPVARGREICMKKQTILSMDGKHMWSSTN
jgi:hypothetical protein